MRFDFDKEKNELLFSERGITFYQVIEAISEDKLLLNIPHPKPDKYPNQWMLVVEIFEYTYCVPYVIDGDTFFLKTIYPNRKYLHLLGNREDKNGK